MNDGQRTDDPTDPARSRRFPYGQFGLWGAQLDLLASDEARQLAQRAEQLGATVVWIPESIGREALAHAALLLERTQRITIATGIANIWARDPTAARNGANVLAEAHPGRFILGLGVSHAPLVARRGAAYGQPLTAMRRYLEAMSQAPYRAPAPEHPAPTVLAALGPAMLALARDHADGAHTFCVTPAHTAFAREVLGSEPWLAVHQAVLLDTDEEAARQLARTHLRTYLALPNYRRNLERLGWTPSAMDNEANSDLVDALVAWGDNDAVAKRLLAHLQAGADHVAIQVVEATPSVDGPAQALEQLREALPQHRSAG